MTGSESKILRALAAGALGTSALATASGLSRRTLESVRPALAARGLVEKHGNGRDTTYSLTPAGVAIATPANPRSITATADAVAGVSGAVAPVATPATPPQMTPADHRKTPAKPPQIEGVGGGGDDVASLSTKTSPPPVSLVAVSVETTTATCGDLAVVDCGGGLRGCAGDAALAKIASLEIEVARLASIVVKLQGSIQGLLASGKRVGVASAAVSEQERLDVQDAVEEALLDANRTGEVGSEHGLRAVLYQRMLAATAAGDRYEVDTWLAAKKWREEAPHREADRVAALEDSKARDEKERREINEAWERAHLRQRESA